MNLPCEIPSELTNAMKTITLKVGALILAIAGTSCMTTYDAYGRPVQTVDPGAAAAIAVGAAAVGYGIGQHNDNHYHGHHHYYGY